MVLKRWIIAVVILSLIVIASFAYVVLRGQQRDTLLKKLHGEVVFLRRDGEFMNVYTMPVFGSPTMVFHNDEQTPSKDGAINQNSLYPRWVDNSSKIRFIAMRGTTPGDMNTGGWKLIEIDADGKNPIIIADADTLDRFSSLDSRSDDLIVEKGNVLTKEGGQMKKIYNFSGYDPKINPGASEVSWSPDKQYVIFQSCFFFKGCSIYFADRLGENVIRLTDGEEPDWKY